MMVFPLLAGGLMVVGWQYPFLLFGFSFPIAGILYILLDEPALTSSDSGKARKKTGIQELRELIRQPRILSIVLARGFPNIVWTAFLTYNSIVVVQLLDGTAQQAGLLVSIGSAAFALSASQAGRITAVFNSRLLPLVAANLALTLGSMLIAFGDLILVFIGATVIGLGFGITMSIYRSIITGYAPLQHRGGLVSIAESVGRVTATTTPILMGAAIAYGSERFGFTGAVRWTFFGISLFGGLAGVILVGISSRSAPVRD